MRVFLGIAGLLSSVFYITEIKSLAPITQAGVPAIWGGGMLPKSVGDISPIIEGFLLEERLLCRGLVPLHGIQIGAEER